MHTDSIVYSIYTPLKSLSRAQSERAVNRCGCSSPGLRQSMSGSRVLQAKDGAEFAVHWSTVESAGAGGVVEVVACDGESVWTSTIDGSLKPKSQNQLSAANFLASIPVALGETVSQFVVDVSVDPDTSGHAATLTIKKKIEDSTSQLMWCKACMHRQEGAASAMRFISCLVDTSAAQRLRLDDLAASNTALTGSLKTLADDFENYRVEQEGFNKTIVTKTCLLLNAKKIEIRRLQSELEDSKSRVSASQSSQQSQSVKRPAPKRRKITADESDDSTSLAEVKVHKEAVPRARSTRTSRAKKPNRSLSETQPLGDDSELTVFCKSGSIEMTGAELETVLSQQGTRAAVESGTEHKSKPVSVSISQVQSNQLSASSSTATAAKVSNSQNMRVKSSLSQLINASSDDDDEGVSSYLY